jgi:hypothetical protein
MIRMPSRWTFASALIFAFLTFASDAMAQVLSQRQCQTTWQGQLIQGVVQVEWLPYSQTHRIYGQFRDPPGNLIEFEVITNQPGGVGGMWFNNARHREIHIELAILDERTFDIRGDAGTARYFCR